MDLVTVLLLILTICAVILVIMMVVIAVYLIKILTTIRFIMERAKNVTLTAQAIRDKLKLGTLRNILGVLRFVRRPI